MSEMPDDRYELSQLGVDIVLVQPSSYPTEIFSTAQQPADAQRISSYGEIGGVPTKMVQTFTEIFQGENAPNPHDVAEAIVKILDQPQGSRSARVIVGQSFGADVINAQSEGVQSQLLEGLGLSFLAQPPAVLASK